MLLCCCLFFFFFHVFERVSSLRDMRDMRHSATLILFRAARSAGAPLFARSSARADDHCRAKFRRLLLPLR